MIFVFDIAQIIRKISSELEILFVDYGNKALVKANQVRLLRKRFCENAPFAIHCQLDEFDGLLKKNSAGISK